MSKRKSRRKTALPPLLEAALSNEPEIIGIDGFDSEDGADFVREVINDLEFWHDEEGGCYVAPIAFTNSQWKSYKEYRSVFARLHMKPLEDSDGDWWMEFYPNGLPKQSTRKEVAEKSEVSPVTNSQPDARKVHAKQRALARGTGVSPCPNCRTDVEVGPYRTFQSKTDKDTKFANPADEECPECGAILHHVVPLFGGAPYRNPWQWRIVRPATRVVTSDAPTYREEEALDE